VRDGYSVQDMALWAADGTLITLAAGIGANTVVFSVLEGVLLKPLPYPRPTELVGVWHSAPGLALAQLVRGPERWQPGRSASGRLVLFNGQLDPAVQYQAEPTQD